MTTFCIFLAVLAGVLAGLTVWWGSYRETAEGALLAALKHGPGSGKELIARVKLLSLGKVVIYRASVFGLLHDLEDAGLVTSYEEPGSAVAERGMIPSRRYSLKEQSSDTR